MVLILTGFLIRMIFRAQILDDLGWPDEVWLSYLLRVLVKNLGISPNKCWTNLAWIWSGPGEELGLSILTALV